LKFQRKYINVYVTRDAAADPATQYRLLHHLDTLTLADDASMMKTAEEDELFLKQDARNLIKAINLDGLRNIFDLTTLLLSRLQHFPGSGWTTHGGGHKNHHISWVGFTCHKTTANLEHLLRCLQQATLEALISDKLKTIEAEVARWHHYWQLSRTIFQKWYSEWPNGQRPLNTTWPWNVRPSLVVLWGVCWMFLEDHPVRKTRKPPPPQQPDPLMPSDLNQQCSQQLVANSFHLAPDEKYFAEFDVWNYSSDVSLQPWVTRQVELGESLFIKSRAYAPRAL
jgi:hypothetical protein